MQVTPFNSLGDLQALIDSLHDERFDAHTATYDRETRQWSARFLRRVYDSTRTVRERRGLFRSRYFFPVVETTVAVRNVIAARLHDAGNTGTDTFAGCEQTPSGCRFSGALWINIALEIEGPITGEVRERELEHRGYVDTFLGSERIMRIEGLE